MRLYETFGKTGFHTCIATSFGIDFDAYENVMLARLRGAGCHNNLLAVDARMLALALEGGSERPAHAGRSYSVIPVGGLGVFHPKVTLQLGRSSARVIVSSANITAAGLAGNLEVAGAIEAEDVASSEMRLIASAWRFLSTLLDPSLDGVNRQIEWMHWDDDLVALNFLLGRIEPAETCLLLDHGYQVFRPGKIARGRRAALS